MSYVRNAWYVAGWASEFDKALKRVVILEQPLVRQCNQVMENTSVSRRISLESTNLGIGFNRQFSLVVFNSHQFVTLISIQRTTFFLPCIEHLLTEVKRPVKRWAVVINKLCIWNGFTYATNHAGNLPDMRLFSFNPQ